MGLGAEFHELFRGLERAHGTYQVGKKSAKGKVEGKARTLQEPVTDELWIKHLKGEQGLGIVPINDQDECIWAAIDIDIYEGLDHKQIESTLKKLKLPLIPCSTKSGGIHLYLFMNEPVKAKVIRKKMTEWAAILGHANAEIFPKQNELKDNTGNWINMPYFDANRTNRYAIKNGKALKPQAFLKLARTLSMSAAQLKKIDVNLDAEMEGAPPCIKTLWVAGIPDGTRDKALFHIGVFLKRKYEDDWEDKLYDVNDNLCHPPIEKSAVGKIIKSLTGKEYYYLCDKQPMVKLCNKDVCSKVEFGVGSEGPGVELSHLRRMVTPAGELVKWIVAVDGNELELEETNDLLLQDRFTRVCYEKLLILPNKCSVGMWRNTIRGLHPVEDVPAPEDASLEGQFIKGVEDFIGMGLGRTQDALLGGRPILEEGHYLFQSVALLEHFKGKKIQITAQKAWSILEKRTKSFRRRLRVKGKRIHVWCIPEDNISTQTEEFDKPDVAGGF